MTARGLSFAQGFTRSSFRFDHSSMFL
jgi:hypothetical protein